MEGAAMLLAGPIPGILLGYILLNFGLAREMNLLIQLGVILIFLNVMNLIPIDPLDGGKLMRVLFFASHDVFQLVFTGISSLIIIALGLWFNSWILIIFGFLLGFRVKSIHKLYLIRKNMREEEIPFETNYEELSDKSYSKIKKIIIEFTPILKDIEEYNDVQKYDQIVARQVDNVLEVPTNRDASVLFKSLMLFIWIGAILLSLHSILSHDFNAIIHAFQNR